MTELRLGATLGRYRVEALLGHGSTGSVYAAEDVMLERRVALKVLLPELARVVRVSGSDQSRSCLHVFEADSADALEEVGRRAETPFDRVVEASEVAVPTSERRRR